MTDIPQIVLSESDGELLKRARKVDHPTDFSPLIDILPADIKDIVVVGAYSIRKDDPRGLANCAVCGRHHNHSHGVMLGLSNGYYSTLGRYCARNRHQIIHSELIKKYDEETRRAETLRRLMFAREQIPGIVEFLEALLNAPQVLLVKRLSIEFEKKFGKLHRYISTSNGRLNVKQWVTDDLKMAERRKHRDNKILQLERQLNRSDITVEFARNHYRNDPDFSDKAIMKERESLLSTFVGAQLFTKLPMLDNLVTTLSARTCRSLAPLENTHTGLLSDSALFGSLIRFRGALSAAIELVAELNLAAKFFTQTEMQKITQWANLRSDIGFDSEFLVTNNRFTQDYGDGYAHSMDIPDLLPSISAKHLRFVLSSVSDIDSTELAYSTGAPA